MVSKGKYYITALGKEDLKRVWFRRKSSGIVHGRMYGIEILKILRTRLESGASRTTIEDKLGLVPYYKGPKQFRDDKADLVKALRGLRAKGLIVFRP